MEGLRANARDRLLLAMEKGGYTKTREERTAEAANFEIDTWKACGSTYCVEYVNKMNKRCRDLWSLYGDIPWFFPGVERLVDVTEEVLLQMMRDFVTTQEKAKILINECTSLREHLDMMNTVVDLKKRLDPAYNSTKQLLTSCFHKLEEPFHPDKLLNLLIPVQQSNVTFTDLLIRMTAILEKMKQKNYVWLDEAAIKVLILSVNAKTQEAEKLRIEIAKLLDMRKQLRIVYPQQIALIEAFAQIYPNDEPVPIPPPSQKGLNGEPPKKRAATDLNKV